MVDWLDEAKNRAVVLAGALVLVAVGRDRFYQMAQDKSGFTGRIASAFCGGHAGRIGENYSIYRSEKDKERITDIALRLYSDDSLMGFGDADYVSRADGKPLLDQQRGLVIPMVEEAIASDKPKRVIEIGTGNGDVIAYLSAKYPDVEFVGIDLSVVVAIEKHGVANSNLSFKKGYALDLLNEGLSGDVVFGTSTFVAFSPKELEAYLDTISQASRIVISDPVTFGNTHTRDLTPRSRHMDTYMWWHNYFGYLSDAGWTIDTFETVGFEYSHNRNAKVVLISAYR